MLYDYYCWNLKLISTKKFYTSIKGFEKIIYNRGLMTDNKRVTRMVKVTLGVEKPQKFFEELDPKFNIFKEKRKRYISNTEELLDADDVIKGNLIKESPEVRRVRLKIRRKKKKSEIQRKVKKKKESPTRRI
jgi:hypothetical protein